jgi:cytidylate kinase
MSIITISRGTASGGKEFAENLAAKLGYPCLSREQLSEEAIKLNVPVGKLQTAMVKPPRVYKRLGAQREFYLSTVTMILCKYAQEGNLVYHGHTGHLLLSGVPHIFRIRVLADMEYRIENVMNKLGLSREKAVIYIQNVDTDRDKWVRFLYGVDWHDPSQYDLIVNLDHLGIANAATALCAMVELPDFKLTPASDKALKNLYLTSRARFLLASDHRTSYADLKVSANNGVVQVICQPQQAEVAEFVNEVLAGLEDCKEVHCTIAGSTILWLDEEFDVKSELFHNVVKVAKKWDAAVEIMRHTSEQTEVLQGETSVKSGKDRELRTKEYNGGIEDDIEDEKPADKTQSMPVLDALLNEKCSGGSSTFYGNKESLMVTLGQRTNYQLMVIGKLFKEKSESAQIRLTGELKSFLIEHTDIPVVGADELKKSLKFGFKDFFKLALGLAITFVLFIAVFLNQEIVLKFIAGSDYISWRIPVTICIVIFIPVFAFSFGTSTKQIFKLIGLD